MKPCEIAVIVPVHNAAAFLTACTDAIAAQKFDGFRCILVEDGSTDDSPALCDAIAAGDQRFVALHQTNSGVCAARTVGVREGRALGAKWFAFCDADDLYHPEFLDTLYAAVTNSGLPLACCRYDTFTDTVPADAPAPCNSKILRSPAHLDALLHDHAVDYGLWNKLFSADLLTEEMLDNGTDAVFEHINYAAVKADTALAQEKGRYALFEGSDWQTGAYFEKRGYTSEKWQALAETVAVQGMRNAYLLAVAPTSSTSILSGTSAGIDPIMKKFFLEEKKGSMLPRVAPELSMDTWWYYKAAHLIDQSWSVRAAGLRQRHIDQAQSMNLYITNDYSMRQVLRLYLEAWRAGVKTIYYVRSKALEVEACESCSS